MSEQLPAYTDGAGDAEDLDESRTWASDGEDGLVSDAAAAFNSTRRTRRGNHARGLLRRSQRLAAAAPAVSPVPARQPARSPTPPAQRTRIMGDRGHFLRLHCLQQILDANDAYYGLEEGPARVTWLGRPAKLPPPELAFTAASGSLEAFSTLCERVEKLAQAIKVCRLIGPNEDQAEAHVVAAFSGAALPVLQTAMSQAPPSTPERPRIHAALTAMLKAFLPAKASRLWRAQLRSFEWPATASLSEKWAELDRLWRQHHDIVGLTATNALHHRRQRLGSPRSFVQVLEDVGPSWVLRALDHVNIEDQTLAGVRAILDDYAPDSGSPSLLLALPSRDRLCYYCGLPGHTINACPRRLSGLPAVTPPTSADPSAPYVRPGVPDPGVGAAYVTGVHALPSVPPPPADDIQQWATDLQQARAVLAQQNDLMARQSILVDQQTQVVQELRTALHLERGGPPPPAPHNLPDHQATLHTVLDNQAWADSLPENALSSFRPRARPASRKDGDP